MSINPLHESIETIVTPFLSHIIQIFLVRTPSNTKLFQERQVIPFRIVTAMRIMVFQNGKAYETVLVLEFGFFKHVMKKTGYMRGRIAECPTAYCSQHQ